MTSPSGILITNNLSFVKLRRSYPLRSYYAKKLRRTGRGAHEARGDVRSFSRFPKFPEILIRFYHIQRNLISLQSASSFLVGNYFMRDIVKQSLLRPFSLFTQAVLVSSIGAFFIVPSTFLLATFALSVLTLMLITGDAIEEANKHDYLTVVAKFEDRKNELKKGLKSKNDNAVIQKLEALLAKSYRDPRWDLHDNDQNNFSYNFPDKIYTLQWVCKKLHELFHAQPGEKKRLGDKINANLKEYEDTYHSKLRRKLHKHERGPANS